MHDPVAFATVLLVIATAGLWFTTFLLWRSTAQLAKDAKEDAGVQAAKMERSAAAMERVAKSTEDNTGHIIRSVGHQETFGKMQMRAYISVLIGKGRYQDEAFLFEMRPQIVNTGHTPARDLRWRIAMDVLPNPLPDGYRFPMADTEVRGGLDLPPHQDGYMQIVHHARLDPEQAEHVKWGMHASCYVWGIVWYRDAFGDRHHTTFAQRIWWEPAEIKDDKSVIWGLEGQYLQRHNRST
jgi:hypothetical protein